MAAAPGCDAAPAAAALALAAGERCGATATVLDLSGGRRRRSGLLASEGARRLAGRIGAASAGLDAVPRGHLVFAFPTPADAESAEGRLSPAAARGLIGDVIGDAPLVVHLPAVGLHPLIEAIPGARCSALVQAGPATPRSLLGLVAIELRRLSVPVKIWTSRPGGIQARRALAGLDPGGATAERAHRGATALLGEHGQALPALVGLLGVVAALTLALVAIGGAASAKGRLQRAADLAAVSAARSMRDDFDRLFVPARQADGTVDPRHLARTAYLDRARRAAATAAARNGLDPDALRVRFVDAGSFAPLRVRVSAEPRIRVAGERLGGEARTRVAAEALAAPVPRYGFSGAPNAEGGGYSGPLVERQGSAMRPDVAGAFDRLGGEAARSGHALVVNSGFRSDAEQARLFAANPDPRMVAPPGTSLHRCGTELDLGPPSAHAWLAANAQRFGFVRRYSWEPWHFGYVRRPAPCSAAGDRVGADPSGPEREGGDGRAAAGAGLPGFVPRWVRRPLLASASAHGVSAALLAAQLMAESNFNPAAVSPAGARGIAQFMPATAAAYGLRDPFDVEASIDAQARLMGDLLARFGAPRLALAAYNAGPAPVSACDCVPPYPETQAYVARILGLLDGAGALSAPEPPLEVRLLA